MTNHATTHGPRPLIIALTGATGAIFGIRALEMLRESDVDAHLVLSRWAARTIQHETNYTVEQVQRLAREVYAVGDQGAAISSGSFLNLGMLIAPCSMRTLAAIAHGLGDNLIHRAADVTLKERRKLVLAVREAPFNDIHLENMLKLSKMGVSISPPVPAFYHQPRTIDDIVNHTVVRLLDQFGIAVEASSRWTGAMRGDSRASRETVE